MSDIQKVSWKTKEVEQLSNSVARQAVYGENGTMAQLFLKRGAKVARHWHINEEYGWILSGAAKYDFDDREFELRAGEAAAVPPGMPHAVVALEESVAAYFFTPVRED